MFSLCASRVGCRCCCCCCCYASLMWVSCFLRMHSNKKTEEKKKHIYSHSRKLSRFMEMRTARVERFERRGATMKWKWHTFISKRMQEKKTIYSNIQKLAIDQVILWFFWTFPFSISIFNATRRKHKMWKNLVDEIEMLLFLLCWEKWVKKTRSLCNCVLHKK